MSINPAQRISHRLSQDFTHLGLWVRKFPPENFQKFLFRANFRQFSLKIQYKPFKLLYICLHIHFLPAFTALLWTNSNTKTLFSWLIVLIGIVCMVSIRSTLVPGLSVIFTIRENFRKFPPSTKFPENLNPTHTPIQHHSQFSLKLTAFKSDVDCRLHRSSCALTQQLHMAVGVNWLNQYYYSFSCKPTRKRKRKFPVWHIQISDENRRLNWAGYVVNIK